MGDMHFFYLQTPVDLHVIEGCGFALDTGHANINHCLPVFYRSGFLICTFTTMWGGEIPTARLAKELSILSR